MERTPKIYGYFISELLLLRINGKLLYLSNWTVCVCLLMNTIFLIMILLDWMYNIQLFIKQTVIQI